jgi:hypothetical protein
MGGDTVARGTRAAGSMKHWRRVEGRPVLHLVVSEATVMSVKREACVSFVNSRSEAGSNHDKTQERTKSGG